MHRFLIPLITLSAGLCLAQENPYEGFTSLFNGKDLSGWRGGTTFDHRQLQAMPEAERAEKIKAWTATMTETGKETGKPHWYVEGNELVNDGFGDYATTEKDYGNFELLLEYKTVAKADSGIYLRGVPQVQIWDSTESDAKAVELGKPKGSGGLWNNSAGAAGKDPLVKADKPFGEWNQFRIIMLGSRVSVWLNGQLVVDHAIMENFYDKKKPEAERLPIPALGPIQLQTHGGEIRWKNIYIREIDNEETARLLAEKSTENFTQAWNGKDFTGWAGPLENYEIVNGSLRCQSGKGGHIYWNTELGDFVARVQFKVPTAGNNGLAIRYPGNGEPAYDGMTELQVLDENYDKVKGAIDPRQVHGSAYGMVGAARGYQNPVGEWNFQEVTVKGSTVKVELNGTVILDADLSKVDPATYMQGKAHPGKDRTHGFFGLAGHNDPVEFKDILIKKL